MFFKDEAKDVMAAHVKQHPYWWDAARPVQVDFGPLPKQTDVAIVGSGFTALRAALLLARGGRSVTIIDREDPGFGAARRNAGFLGRVLKKSFLGLMNTRGLPHASNVYRELDLAYQSLMSFIDEEGISCFAAREGRFMGATSATHYELLARDLEAMKKHLNLPYEMVPRGDVHNEFASEVYFGGAVIPDLGSLHPGLYHKQLQDLVTNAGATIHGRTEVVRIRDQSGPFRFEIETSAGGVSARDVIIATNGYTTPSLSWWARRVIPFQGYMAATEALPEELFRKILPNRRVVIDTNTNIDFFRVAPDSNRILMGGATAGGMQTAPEIAVRLHGIMGRVLKDLQNTKFTHVWSGFCAGTFDVMPHAGGRNGMWYAMGYNFAGVTMGSYLGQKIAQQILGDPEGKTVFSEGKFPTIPFYNGNPWFMPTVMKYFDWRDRRTARTPVEKLKPH